MTGRWPEKGKEVEHTKEPWSVFKSRKVVEILGPSGDAVIHWTGFDATRVPESAEANARRIVACVNACAGIHTGALEAEPQRLTEVIHYAVELQQQRDQLLAALKSMVEMMDSGDEPGAGSEWHQQACAAIADVEGKIHG